MIEKNLCLKHKHPQIKCTKKEEREIWNISVQSEWMALYPMVIFLIICQCSGNPTLHWLSFTVSLTKVGIKHGKSNMEKSMFDLMLREDCSEENMILCVFF